MYTDGHIDYYDKGRHIDGQIYRQKDKQATGVDRGEARRQSAEDLGSDDMYRRTYRLL